MNHMHPEPGLVRIGEVSRRLGVSTHVLRAWERRYGLLMPVRSSGGYRLYSEADEERVRTMQAYLACGLSTAEAARAALEQTPDGGDHAHRQSDGIPPDSRSSKTLTGVRAALGRALESFDEPAAEATLDRLLADFTIETAFHEVLLPYLHGLGDRWERGEVSVAQEHFASNVLRARLASLGRGWGRGHGPRVLLACAPGEEHDIPLMAFGVILHRGGWRVTYLGANTPVADVIIAAAAETPKVVVLSAVGQDRFDDVVPDLERLAHAAPLALGGRGATPENTEAAGARLLAGEVVTEAKRLSPSEPAS
jgi:DNA-binding transcriptional MerR regulator